jgi:hypothetical protein
MMQVFASDDIRKRRVRYSEADRHRLYLWNGTNWELYAEFSSCAEARKVAGDIAYSLGNTGNTTLTLRV